MNKILDKLWNEYLIDDCAIFDTDEERGLSKRVSELHGQMAAMLDRKSLSLVEEYVSLLLELEGILSRKAFIRGCEFSASFILEVTGSEGF